MIVTILYLIIIAVWSSHDDGNDEIEVNIEDSLQCIRNTPYYDIIDHGYLIKNPNGSSQGNPGGGYGNFQFENNIIITDEVYTGITTQFVIESNDAVIFIGKTPPKCKYFSYALNLCEELISYNTTNEERIELWSTLVPSLNHLMINTSSDDSVFDETIIIIFTGSKKTYSDLYDIFASYNLGSIINLVPIVSDYTNFKDDGGPSMSGLNVLIRVAIPDDIIAFTSFMNTPQNIYYISHTKKSKKKKRRRHRRHTKNSNKYLSENWAENKFSESNVNETELYSELFAEYQQDIISYLASTYDMKFDGYFYFFSPYHPNDFQYFGNYGWDCIDTGANCRIDNRDSYYSVSTNSQTQLLNDPKSFWLLVGVNHYETNQTTYSLFALWSGNPQNFRVKTYQVNNFEYGDKQLLSDPRYSVFFSVQFSRQENCLSGIAGFCIDYNEEDTTEQFYLMLGRDYLNPTTKTRPNEDKLIKHILMKFTLP